MAAIIYEKAGAVWMTVESFPHAACGIPAIVTLITQALTRDYVELGYVAARRDFCFVKDGAEGRWKHRELRLNEAERVRVGAREAQE